MKSQLTAALSRLFSRLMRVTSPLWRWEARFKGVEFLGSSEFLGRPLISVARGGKIVLEDGVKVASSRRGNVLGLAQPCVLRALAPGAQLVLGKNVGVSGSALCAAASIEVGEGTIIGAGAMVFDTDFHHPVGEWGWDHDYAANARPIFIGRGVFIGARAIILKGVKIGDRAIIGAGAVVTKDVPERYVAAGNPARCIHAYTP